VARDTVQDSETFVTEVCWHYYVNEMTQAEVARHLNVTRLRVNQAIQRAKAMGMVKVQIESPFLQRVQLQEDLTTALSLNRALVAPANKAAYDYHTPVGAALAAHLTERLATGDWKSIGVSWGLTVEAATNRLTRQSHPDLEIVSILGGTAKGSTFNSFGIASGLADVLGADFSLLTAPIYLNEGVDRAAFLAQPSLREHFDKFDKLDAVLLTCSNVSDKSFLVQHGLPAEITPSSLRDQGAIGDVLGHFLDKDGNSVATQVDERTIGMSIEQVREIPEKIMIAAGPHKVEIIKAACKRGFVDTLITDDSTAELLLLQDG